MFPQKSPFCPLFGPFYPHFAIPSAWESGRGQSLSGTQGTSVATFAPGTTVGPQPRSARSTPGEPGRAADRQVFQRADQELKAPPALEGSAMVARPTRPQIFAVN